MSKVTSKLQVTLPKAIAERYGIRPGDNITWAEAGDVIRVVVERRKSEQRDDPESRLRLFDHATRRHNERDAERKPARSDSRGWTREDLYERGRTR